MSDKLRLSPTRTVVYSATLPIALLAGCAGSEPQPTERPAEPMVQAPVEPAPEEAPKPERPGERVLYFATDVADVRTADVALLEGHARYLQAHPGLILRVAGHADERGTDEYNLALSERRAAEVKRLLTERGAPAARVLVEAMGESRPASDDWAENRRVELEYTESFALTRIEARN